MEDKIMQALQDLDASGEEIKDENIKEFIENLKKKAEDILDQKSSKSSKYLNKKTVKGKQKRRIQKQARKANRKK